MLELEEAEVREKVDHSQHIASPCCAGQAIDNTMAWCDVLGARGEREERARGCACVDVDKFLKIKPKTHSKNTRVSEQLLNDVHWR